MPPHILVVEDEEPLLELLRYNFEKAGYAVETIAEGGCGEVRLKETVPDLLVLDWMLPGFRALSCAAVFARRSQPRTCPLSC